MPGQAVSGSGPHCVWGRRWASAARTTVPSLDAGGRPSRTRLLFEKHKHGDARDAAGALPGVQRGRGAGAHHEGPREGEGGQAERREWGPLPCPGGTPGAPVGRKPAARGSSPQSSLEVCAGTALRELATLGAGGLGCRAAREEGRWFRGASAWPSPARPPPRPCAWPWVPVGREGSETCALACQALSCLLPLPGRAWGWETP